MFGQGYVLGSLITAIGLLAVREYIKISTKEENDEE